jgi:hypothetical protein
VKPINPNRDTRQRYPRNLTLVPKKRPGRPLTRKPSGGLGYYVSEPTAQNLTFWYHRWEASPTFTVERIARVKGMIPIFNISNATFSWGSTYETLALQFQVANNNCTIAMAQAFWSQLAVVGDEWPVGEMWAKTYPDRRLADTANRIMIMDVEPPNPINNSIITNNLNVHDPDEDPLHPTIGLHGTPTQVADAIAFVAAHDKFAYALPDLRGRDSIVATTVGSLYNVLPTFGVRRINEGTYPPGQTLDLVDPTDVIGLRVTTDGRSTSYTPEEAKAAFPGRDKMYFNIETTETAKLNIVNRL